jgi:hypothetical protein
LDVLTLKPERSLLDVVHGKRDARDRALVAGRLGRRLTADSTTIFHELEPLGAQAHRDDSNTRSRHSKEARDVGARGLDVGHLLEQECTRIEIDGAVHVPDRDGQPAHGARGRSRPRRRRPRGRQIEPGRHAERDNHQSGPQPPATQRAQSRELRQANHAARRRGSSACPGRTTSS